jgi:PGF-CTERM protein
VGTDAETTESATTTAVAVGTDAETAAPGADTPTSTPGFGVIVALAALLVVGVLSSRLAA